MRILLWAALMLLVGGLLAGCGGDSPKSPGPTATTPATPGASTPDSPTPSPTAAPTAPSTPTASTSPPNAAPVEGIDASHHQGPIDWAKVADHGITFAYLKASEGTSFTDPRFADHRRAAAREGIAVTGYHYFQLCSDGAAQARHFAEVLGPKTGPGDTPPALDLELAGSCSNPPDAATLLTEVREFLDVIDNRYATRTLVYLYPDFEDRFGFADDLADHPQWVRRLGDRAPRRTWSVWQYDDQGSVPGISGGVDLNRRQPGTSTAPGR